MTATNRTVLVAGATGNVGTPLTTELLRAGVHVRAGSRRGTAITGAEGVAFDLADSTSVARALDGVGALYLLAPTGTIDPRPLLLPVIEAATARGIKVVLQTVIGVDADDSIPYRQVELALAQSGTPFVILRPNWFADNFHTSWRPALAQGVITVPAADGKSSFIDVRDIAASGAAALTTTRFDGRAFNLTGPAALGYADVAAVLSDVIGRPITYTPIDDDAFVGLLTSGGVPEAYARFLASIFYPVRQGWTAVVSPDVETLTGRTPRSFDNYARDHETLLR